MRSVRFSASAILSSLACIAAPCAAQPEPDTIITRAKEGSSSSYTARFNPSTYSYDNGIAPFAIGTNSGPREFLWLHRYDAAGGEDAITSVSLAWDNIPAGTAARLYIFKDPNNDGNPADRVLLASQDITASNPCSCFNLTYTVYPLDVPLPVSGVIYIGASVVAQSGQFPVQVDNATPFVAGRSFLASAVPPLNASTVALGPRGTVANPETYFIRANGSNAGFTYQGSLDVTGAAYTGNADLLVGIYDAASAGNAVSANFAIPGVAFNSGRFSVRIPADASSFDPGADRWLEIGVKRAGEAGYTTLSPRQRITSVPTALAAARVNWNGVFNAPASFPPWNQISGGISYSAGNVGVGTTTPAAALQIGPSDRLLGSLGGRSGGFITSGAYIGNTIGDNAALANFGYWCFPHSGPGTAPALSIHARKTSGASGWQGTSVGFTQDVDNTIGAGGSGLWFFNGNVGIGTTTPGARLHVQGGRMLVQQSDPDGAAVLQFLNGTDVGFCFLAATGNLHLRTQTAAKNIILDGGGNVGIGTLNPTQAKLVVNGSVDTTLTNTRYLDSSGGPFGPLTLTTPVSIYANQAVAANRIFIFSDARTKRIEGRSDGARDLQTLLGVEITDYTFKDTIGKGTQTQKKVIAQQVEKIYPQAVSKNTDVVPDIYKQAIVSDGWITLATDLKTGDKVRLIGEKEEGVHEVLEVRADGGAFRTAFKPATEKVFVYGRQVNDFMSVDYEAIAMLNVSATQELARQSMAQQKRIDELETLLRSKLDKIETALAMQKLSSAK